MSAPDLSAPFVVNNAVTHEPVIKIENGKVEFNNKTLEKHLGGRIPTGCCGFIFKQDKKDTFGTATWILRKDPRYCDALKRYCETQFLSHPESFTDKPKKQSLPRLRT